MTKLVELLAYLQRIPEAGGSVSISLDHVLPTHLGFEHEYDYGFTLRTLIKNASLVGRGLTIEIASQILLEKIKIKYPA